MQLFTSGDSSVLSHDNFVVDVICGGIGAVVEGTRGILSKLTWSSSDVVGVLRFLGRFLDLHITQIYQWVLLLWQEILHMVEPGDGGGYVRLVLHLKH